MTGVGGAIRSIPGAAAAAADLYGDRTAVVDGVDEVSYSELLARARTFGAGLVASGVERGDRVALWAPNSLSWIVAVLGLLEAGAVLVPINTRFKGPEAAEVVRRGGVRVLVTVTDFLGTDFVALLREADGELALQETVVLSGPVPQGCLPLAELLSRATDEARAELTLRAAALGPQDPSDILFTSGTTGSPKGVVQTHGRTLCVARDWVAMTGLTVGDRYLMINPYFHMFGFKAGILASIVAGATMLPERVFDADRVLARVAADRVTVLPGPPTLYQSLLDHPSRDAYDVSSLRVAVTGAADIPVELIRRVHDELPFSTVITGYGLTEAGTAASTGPGDDAETIATTVGRARPGFELLLVDSAGVDVAAGEPGDILVRGGSVMSHYLDNPEATAETLSEDGWLRTGDIGVLTPAGCLRIVGRSKDMFLVGGFNAYPAEIENALMRHADVQQVAVIGIPDERLGEVGMAFVVLRADSATTARDLLDWSRAQMANYKVPRRIELVADLPANATGKVVKDVLRERARQLLDLMG